ncbi:MAG TPA: SCP2 sterol-binding domain-containing protein [Acidimicrobiales bacterium]
MRYLSPRWIDAAREAVAADDGLAAALAGVTLTVEQTVEGGPDGTVTWHVAIDDGKVALAPGPAARPDLRFATGYATAAQIASGALAAQRAFVEGRLRVGGDLSLLMTHQRALAAVHDALVPVRAGTTYE